MSENADVLVHTIAYANPKYRKYIRKETLLIILFIFIGIPFFAGAPPLGIIIMVALILSFVSSFRKGNKLLLATEEEIRANNYSAPWWNEKNKAYRKYMKQVKKQQTVSSATTRVNHTQQQKKTASATQKAVANAAAAYTVGKTVQTVRKQNRPTSKQLNSHGKTYILTTQPNGDQKLSMKAGGNVVGKYNSAKDITTDAVGRKIGKGNILEKLI